MITLIDTMTYPGRLIEANRFGMNKSESGVLAKSTFEETTKVLFGAALGSQFDNMRGVSANVMCGQYGHYGTNAFNLVLDLKEMMKLSETDVNTTNVNSEIEKVFNISTDDKNSACAKSKIEITNNIVNIHKGSITTCDDNYNMGF